MWALVILAVLVVLGVTEIVLTETEKFGWATVTLVVAVVLAQCFHVVNILQFVTTHFAVSLLYVLVYMAVGVAWSFVKWFSFLMQYRDRFREARTAFLADRHLDTNLPIPEDKLDEFKSYMQRFAPRREKIFSDMNWLKRPRAAGHKGRIVSWMSFWPFSMVGTVLNDPVRRLFNWLFSSFKALYQKMSDHVFAKDAELQ